jgi:hypothetical protein
MGSVPRSLLALRVGILALLLPLSACQANNPILTPQTGEIIEAGTTYNITWTPNTGDQIGIELWNGISLANTLSNDCFEDEDSEYCTQVVSSMNNAGFYLWAVPVEAPESNTYWLDIYVPDPGFDGPFFYDTGNFTIRKSIKGHTNASSSASASSVQSIQTGNFCRSMKLSN